MAEEQGDIRVRKDGSICFVELTGRKILEELQIQQLGERLSALADAEPAPRMLLDFSKVEHLSSAALGVLITLNKQVAGNEGQLVLANIPPQIYEVFKITRLNKLFNIQSSTEEAVRALS